jgi:hypothetical protein
MFGPVGIIVRQEAALREEINSTKRQPNFILYLFPCSNQAPLIAEQFLSV